MVSYDIVRGISVTVGPTHEVLTYVTVLSGRLKAHEPSRVILCGAFVSS